MTEIETLLAERACERLVVRYCHLVDHGQAAAIAELFTDDGVWTSPEATMSGREAIRRGFQRRQDNAGRKSRHVCSTIQIELDGADRATGLTYLTLYRHDGDPERATSPVSAPTLVGEYRDVFVRTEEGWRISRRDTSIAFA